MVTVLLRQPLEQSLLRIPKGQTYVIPERCKGCRFCIEFCPETVLAESEGMNAKGYHYPVVAAGEELACVNCRFCKLVCPEFAIYTEEL